MNSGIVDLATAEALRGEQPTGFNTGSAPMAFSGECGEELSSKKLPGFTSRCRMWCEWHCAMVRRTERMKLATCTNIMCELKVKVNDMVHDSERAPRLIVIL